MSRRFEDVEEGDELPTRELFLAKDQVRAYARAANQWSARFTDDEGARKEGLPGIENILRIERHLQRAHGCDGPGDLLDRLPAHPQRHEEPAHLRGRHFA